MSVTASSITKSPVKEGDVLAGKYRVEKVLGIVHRDLKPGNLFLTTSLSGRPLVKILDFGISKTIDPLKVADELSLTKTEMLLGSPLYMSPEQMRSSKHIDARTDIWGLGAI